MSAADFFNAARAYKRELTGFPGMTLTQDDVDALNAVIKRWKPDHAAPMPTGLTDAADFFTSLRPALGGLEQSQVDGTNALLQAMGKARWPRAWAAYGLATAWHETNRSMEPVEEAYYLAKQVKDLDAWRRVHLNKYYPWHGRGYVQLTWERNYRVADAALAKARAGIYPENIRVQDKAVRLYGGYVGGTKASYAKLVEGAYKI